MQKGDTRFASLLRRGAAVPALVWALSASWASAQTVTPELPAETAATAVDGDEIKVVARRREESITDVPASVGVMTGDQLDRLAIKDIADYTRQTPGAILIGSGPAYLNDVALRGQGGGRLGFSESTTGIYRDGIFVAGGGFGGRSFGRIDFYDVDRVEVYRGPQGALYGRNSVGGAVNVISKRPDLDFGAKGKAGYNNVDNLDLTGTINVPLGQTVALRIGGYYADQSGGFYRDEVTGRVIDNTLDWGLRGTLGFGIDTDSTAYLTIEQSRSEAPGFTSIGRNRTLDPDPFVRTGLDAIDRVVIDQTQVIGEFTHKFDGSSLTILANFKGRKGDRTGADFDHYLGIRLPNVALYDAQGEDFDRFGAEVRWASSGSGPLSWLIGADAMTFVSEVYSNRTGTVTGSGSTVIALRRQLRLQLSREELHSYSVYGLVGYDLTDRLNLSFEARFQTDNKDFRFQQIDLDATTNEAIPLTNFSRSWQRFLPTVAINYRVDDRVSLYGRVATGYRPGGFNQSPAQGFFDRTPYDPEDITSGEVGAKGSWRIGATTLRGQIALFYNESRDVQQTTTLSTTNPSFTLENVGSNYIYGGEFELGLRAPVAGGRFSATFNLSGAHGKWKDGASIIASGAVLDLAGKTTPRARDYIISLNGQYDHDVGGGMNLMATASYQTASGGYDDASLTRKSDGYSMLDLSTGIRGEHWSLMGYVKNVTNDLYTVVTVGGNDYFNTPRTYGATLSFDW
jgi:outer membrane receptor protein involved in Fe transport